MTRVRSPAAALLFFLIQPLIFITVKKASDAFVKKLPGPESISRIMEKEGVYNVSMNSNTVVGNAVQFLGL